MWQAVSDRVTEAKAGMHEEGGKESFFFLAHELGVEFTSDKDYQELPLCQGIFFLTLEVPTLHLGLPLGVRVIAPARHFPRGQSGYHLAVSSTGGPS